MNPPRDEQAPSFPKERELQVELERLIHRALESGSGSGTEAIAFDAAEALAGLDLDEQHFYRQFIEKSNDAMYVVDLFGTFRFVNSTAERLIGYSREQLIGRNIARFLYRDGLKKAVSIMASLIRGKEIRPHELVVKTASGDRVGEMTVTLIRRGAFPVGILGIARDVTERRAGMDTLKESEERYRTLVELSPDPIAVIQDESFSYVNQAFLDLFGYSADDIAGGLNYLSLVLPEDREIVRRRYEGRIAGEKIAPVNRIDLVAKDGRVLHCRTSASRIEHDGRPANLVIFNDQSDQVRIVELMKIQHRLAAELSAVHSLGKGLELCLDAAFAVSRMNTGGIYLLNSDGKGFDLVHSSNLTEEFIRENRYYSLDTEQGVIARAGKPIFTSSWRRSDAVRRELLKEGLKALAVLPILHEGQVIGCMNVASKDVVEITPFVQDALLSIRDQIGSAIARLTAETSLRESDERFRRLYRGIPHAALLTDGRGAILDGNPEACRIFGYTVEEFRELRHEDLFAVSGPRDRSTMAAGDSWNACKGVFTCRRRDDTTFTGELTATGFTDRNGEDQVSIIINDITERKRAEDDLRQSEERYRRLVSQIPHGVQETDSRGTILFANPAHHRIHGYPRGELVGKSILDLSEGKEEKEKLRDYLSYLVKNQPRPKPWTGRDIRKDGSTVEVQVDWEYKRDEEGKVVGFTSVISDITSRKEAERALRESEQKFRILAEESPNMIFISKGDQFVYVNEQCVKIMGYTREEYYFEGFQLSALFSPEDRGRFEDSIRRHDEDEEVLPGEYTLVTREGGRMDSLVATKLVTYGGERAILSIVTDITDRKSSEEALRESEERYRSLVDQSREVIFTLTTEGRFSFFNPYFTTVTGWRAEEWLGRTFEDLTHPDDVGNLRLRFGKILKGENLPQNIVRVQMKAGGFITVEYTTVPIRKEGKVIEIWGIARDITSRIKAEEDRGKLAALREREGISRWLHDHLGADLYNIILLVDGIQKKGPDEAVASQQLEWVSETSRNALASIRNYLDFSTQMGASFGSIVRHMEKYGRSLLTPLGMKFSLLREGEIDRCSLSGLQMFSIYLIFKESLTNIVKHARAGRIDVTMSAVGKRLDMTIEDDGEGFVADSVISGHYGTTNLRTRAEELGADLRISSEPKRGTKVEFSMPLD